MPPVATGLLETSRATIGASLVFQLRLLLHDCAFTMLDWPRDLHRKGEQFIIWSREITISLRLLHIINDVDFASVAAVEVIVALFRVSNVDNCGQFGGGKIGFQPIRPAERYSDDVVCFLWESVLCMQFLGASAQQLVEHLCHELDRIKTFLQSVLLAVTPVLMPQWSACDFNYISHVFSTRSLVMHMTA